MFDSGRIVALKIVHASFDELCAPKKLAEELALLNSVRNPRVLRGEAFYADDEFRAYTMEYIEGGSLQKAISDGRLNKLPDQIEALLQVCEGLEAIHDAQIVHRDLKPENILFSTGGAVRIADFGIATFLGSQCAVDATRISGTIDYLSPEYVLEGQGGRLSDIYALGVIGYQLVTGELPFDATSTFDLLAKKTLSEPLAPNAIVPDCPQGLSDLILHALARRPEQRAQSVSFIRDQLEDLLAHRPPGSLSLGHRDDAEVQEFKAVQ